MRKFRSAGNHAAQKRGAPPHAHVHEVGTSPEISSCGGMLVNSSGTWKPTSAKGSEVYVAHSRKEMASARSFKAALAKMYFRRKRNVYLRTGVRAAGAAAGTTMVVRRREIISLSRSLSSSGVRLRFNGSAGSDRNRARFLGDQHDQGVAIFGDSDGRAMPRSELFGNHGIERKRQKAAGRRDARSLE